MNTSHGLKISRRIPEISWSREAIPECGQTHQSLSYRIKRDALIVSGDQNGEMPTHPMRFNPTPPAFALKRKTKLSPLRPRLNCPTTFSRSFCAVVPSSRRYGYFFARQTSWMRLSVAVKLETMTTFSSVFSYMASSMRLSVINFPCD